MNVKQISKLYGVSERTVQRWVKAAEDQGAQWEIKGDFSQEEVATIVGDRKPIDMPTTEGAITRWSPAPTEAPLVPQQEILGILANIEETLDLTKEAQWQSFGEQRSVNDMVEERLQATVLKAHLYQVESGILARLQQVEAKRAEDLLKKLSELS